MKAVVAAFNQEKALVGVFSVIMNLRMELFQALVNTVLYITGTGQILILQHETINPAGTPARARVSGESLISGDGSCHPHHGGNTVTQLHTVSFAAGDQRAGIVRGSLDVEPLN